MNEFGFAATRGQSRGVQKEDCQSAGISRDAEVDICANPTGRAAKGKDLLH